MKKLLLLLLVFITGMGAKAQCNYTFTMYDDYGDGWDGSQMTVVQSATTIATLTGPATFGPTSVVVAMTANTSFSLIWNVAGNWTGEKRIQVFDQNSNLVYEMPFNSGGLAGTTLFTAVSCPTCSAPTALLNSSVTSTTASHSWTAASPAPSNGYQWAVTTSATPPASGTATVGLTSASVGLTANTTYYLHVRSDCSGTFSPWATSSFFTGYCPVSVSNAGDYISSFSTTLGLTNISSSGTGTAAYQNLTAQSVSQIAGGSVSFSGAYAGGNAGFAIWVDWNNNLVFDVSEQMYLAPATAPSWTGSFAVPVAQAVGSYRMRIRGVWGTTTIPACGVAAWGQTEDYTFNVVTPPACPAPTALNVTGITPSTATLNWTAAAGATSYTVEYRLVGSGTWTSFAGNPVAGTSANLTSIATGNYEWQVRTTCGVPTSTFASGTFNNIPYPGTCATAATAIVGMNSAPGATSGAGASNTCFTGATDANWYTYTASVSGTATISSDIAGNPGGLDSRLSVYTGTCGSLTCFASDDDAGVTLGFSSVATFNVCAGTTYYIEWDDRWDGLAFQFSLSETAICAAPSAAVGTPTFNGLAAGTSWTAGGGVGCASSAGYQWEIVADGAAAFAGNAIVSGSGTYPANLPAITSLSSATAYDLYFRDNCGGGSFSTATLANFTTTVPPPANDDCSNAIVVYGGYTVTGFSTAGATGTDITSCTTNDTKDVWFVYTPTCDVTVEVNSCGSSYDSGLSVWTSCSGGTELACNDDALAGPCSGSLQSFISFAATGGTTYYIRIAGWNFAEGNINFSIVETTVCPCTQNVWTGASNTDWSDGTNWTCTVAPSNACGAGSDNAILPVGASQYPIVSAASGVGNLQIAAGASLTLNADLEVCGNVVHNGNPVTGSGNLELMGSATQTISGTGSYTNLVQSNIGAVNVVPSANISVLGSLELAAGTFVNDGSVTLVSNAAGTAYLDDFTGTGSYVGDITVQRFITPGSGLGQRYFGSAVSGSSVSGLDGTYAGFPTGQLIPNGCDPNQLAVGSPYSNLFEWHEDATFGTSCVQEGWFAISAATNLTPARGYSGWMNDGSVLSVTGAPNSGNVNYALLNNTPSGVPNAQGWHLLSNPYPSPMNVNAATASGFTSPQYYNAASGAYSGTFQPALVAGSEVPVMQGFVAQTAGLNTFAPDNSFRVANNNPNFFKSNDWFTYKLDVEVMVNGNADATYLFYSDNNSAQFDAATDCIKRHSDANKPTLYTKLGSDELSLNGFHMNDLGTSVPMGLIAPVQGTYTFNFAGAETFPANTTIYVEDLVTGTFHNIANGAYVFDANPYQNGTDRFMIHYVLPASFNLVEPSCENTTASIIENTNDGRNIEITI
jgi:hypothetical protein